MDTFLGIIVAYFIFYWYMHSKKKKMVSFQPAPENKPFNPIAMINEEKTLNINEIQIKINKRPIKKLGCGKPVELFYNFTNRNFAFAS